MGLMQNSNELEREAILLNESHKEEEILAHKPVKYPLSRIPRRTSSRNNSPLSGGAASVLESFKNRAAHSNSTSSSKSSRRVSRQYLRRSQSGTGSSLMESMQLGGGKVMKHCSSMADLDDDDSEFDDSQRNKNATFAQRKANTNSTDPLLSMQQPLGHHLYPNHQRERISNNPTTSSTTPLATLTTSNITSSRKGNFSTHSAVVARQFLVEDDEDNAISRMNASFNMSTRTGIRSSSIAPSDAFMDEHSSNQDTSFRYDSSSSHHNSNGSLLGITGSHNDFDVWNPEDQRKEWNNQNSPRRNTATLKESSATTTGASSNLFAQRKAFDVDQTINLMDYSQEHDGDDAEYDESVHDVDGYPNRRNTLQEMSPNGRSHQNNSNCNNNQQQQKLGFMQQMNSSLVDIFLDNTSNRGAAGDEYNSRRSRSKKNKKRNKNCGGDPYAYYRGRSRSFCRDLCCSKVSIVLAIGALVAAVVVAWQAGVFSDYEPFWKSSSTESTTTAVSPEDAEALAAHAALEVQLMDDFKQLLVQHQVATVDQLDKAVDTPQYMALQWAFNYDLAGASDIDQARIEAYALALLFFGTNGDTEYCMDTTTNPPHEKTIWKAHTHWMTDKPVCIWYGIDCEEGETAQESSVVHLNLTSNNLQGTLSPELFVGLSNLRTLDLSRNRLSGEFPEMLWQPADGGNTTATPPRISKALEYLWMNDNKFQGTIPTTLAFLHRLRNLRFSNNGLTGTLPAQFNQLAELEILHIQNNALTGQFPYIEGMQALEYLWFFDNEFDQAIPFELFTLPKVVEIRGQHNKMRGTIPPEIENLTNLRIVQLDNNEISGHLTDVFYQNINLVEIHVQKNKLTGQIPKTFGALTNLKLLLLDTNAFTGSIPEELGRMTELREFRVFDTQLTGLMPEGLCALKETHELKFVAVDCAKVKNCTCCDECL